ncbi:MAG: hypothetical protein Q7S85_00630 [Rugosibacter sp.]|nr:hypothetical protein [Rugosibacter sp.]
MWLLTAGPPRQPFFLLPFPLAAAKVRDARRDEAGDITLKPQTHVLREMQHAAPPKPALGAPCTGCGACCLLEPCPVGRLWLGSWRGRCRGLEWDEAGRRYVCGMVRQPSRHLRWLPARLDAWASRYFARRIAAGSGCDADIEVLD